VQLRRGPERFFCDHATLTAVSVIVSREAIEDLRSKYLEILALRLEAGDERMRVRMARLAHRFPGALRELDDLELHEIRRRALAVDAVLRDEQVAERWMEAVALFHALARGALCAKRWLLGCKHVDAEVERAFAASVTELPFPDDARAWSRDLAPIASPPRGRVTEAVFARIALQLGTTESEARHLVFGIPRRERRGLVQSGPVQRPHPSGLGSG
jgi:hypothetical protein